jgi:hypothetical protein
MSLKDSYTSAWEAVSLSFSANASVSENLNLGGFRLFSLVFPESFNGDIVSFQASYDQGSNWHDIWKDGAEYTLSVGEGKNCNVDIQLFSAVPMLRLRAGSADTPVTQSQAVSLSLVLRGI